MGVGTASSGGAMEEPEAVSPSPVTTNASSSSAAPQQSNVDLLADLFGSSGSPTSPSQSQQSPTTISHATGNSLLDLLGGDSQAAAPAAASPSGLDSLAGLSSSLGAASPPSQQPPQQQQQQQTTPGYEAYTKNGLRIHLVPSRDRKNPAIINIQVLFNNSGSQGTVTDLQFQAAVPKSQRLQMATASNTTVEPSGTEKQMMRINNPQQVQ